MKSIPNIWKFNALMALNLLITLVAVHHVCAQNPAPGSVKDLSVIVHKNDRLEITALSARVNIVKSFSNRTTTIKVNLKGIDGLPTTLIESPASVK